MNNPHRLPGAARAAAADDAGPGGGRQMPFLEHLEELRGALLKSSFAIVAGMAGGWFLAPAVMQDLVARTVKTAVVLAPFEAFNERFRLTFILGLGVASPILFWQAWSFVVPGLLKQERRWVPWLAIGSMLLFALGRGRPTGTWCRSSCTCSTASCSRA